MSKTTRRLGDLVRLTGKVIPELENSGENNTVVLEKDDFKNKYLQAMADYAVGASRETGNEISLTNVLGRISLEDSSGNPSAIRDPGENNQEYFSSFTPKGNNILNSTSNSGLLDVDAASGGKFKIKKGKSSTPGELTGNDMLREIEEKNENASIVKRIRQVQKDNNLLTLENPFLPLSDSSNPGSVGSSSVNEDDSNLAIGYIQQEYGRHSGKKFPNSEGVKPSLIKLKDLKKIGLITLLQASGEYYIPNDPEQAGQQLAARGSSFLPGLARMGQRIPFSNISPAKILSDIDPNFKKPKLEDNIKKNEVLTWGNVNSWLVPFDGLNSTASIASASLLILTISGLIKGVAAIAATVNEKPIPTSNMPTEGRRKRLGAYLGKNSNGVVSNLSPIQLNVVSTNHLYLQSVSRGLDIFFGFSNPTATSTKMLTNHGYYNVLLRSIVRNATDIIKFGIGTVVEVKKTGPLDVDEVSVVGNPLGPVEIVKKLNNSQILKFCNILANIGDIALNLEEDGFSLDSDGGLEDLLSDIDKIIPEAQVGPEGEKSLNPAVLQSLNKLGGNYRNALAWGSDTTKSMYLFPESIYRAEARLVGSVDQSKLSTSAVANELAINNLHKIKSASSSNGNRISAEALKAMEDHLEADYMPFYFHDLRTNEIISFHAFLEDVSDSFEAEYSETEGYGRVGQAMTYKNTKRNISLAFRVVATNERDFDHLYFKINKLITLVYPQYSQGRQIGTATNKFIQPFSQVPTSSPMVRIRLGDLFKTNYSKFSLARLFGVGSNQFALQGESGTFSINQNLQRNTVSVRERMGRDGIYEIGEYALISPLPSYAGRGSARTLRGYARKGNTIDSPDQPTQSIRNGVAGRRGAGSVAQGFFTVSNNGQQSISSTVSNGQPLVVGSQTRVRINGVHVSNDGTTKIYNFTVPNAGAGQDGIYVCTQYDLTPDPSEISRIASSNLQPSTNIPTNTPRVVTDFFNSEGTNGNPIVKAFESTAGKGLAGFIKSINFDWSDARWETGRHSARAPISAKILMNFTPIYDINPGLDSDGFMTAPVYNTGKTMSKLNETPDQAIAHSTEEANMDRAILAAGNRATSSPGIPETSNIGRRG